MRGLSKGVEIPPVDTKTSLSDNVFKHERKQYMHLDRVIFCICFLAGLRKFARKLQKFARFIQNYGDDYSDSRSIFVLMFYSQTR